MELIARDPRFPWPTRCLAALVFETLVARSGDDRFDADVRRRLARNRRIHTTTSYDDFVAFSRQECRLAFAREFFSIDDVIARIESLIRRGEGEPDREPHGQFVAEAARAVAALPAMERAIVEHLAGGVWWVAPDTPRTINALVENPPGTVVLTIKPPGSDVEIEVKRAGRPRARPLAVCRHRIQSHRLDGGSLHRHLVFEAKNSAFLSRVYREIHGEEAPIGRTVALAKLPPVGNFRPGQAIQVGTSSFRLDRITLHDPAVRDEIFAGPDTYVSILRQIGTFWGTVVGLCGYSEGESFVPRNVGLRNVGGEVRIIFMDHDALTFSSVNAETFDAPLMFAKWRDDAKYVAAELACLRKLYGAPPAISALALAMKRAYNATHRAMRAMPHYFRPSFLATLPKWGELGMPPSRWLAARRPASPAAGRRRTSRRDAGTPS